MMIGPRRYRIPRASDITCARRAAVACRPIPVQDVIRRDRSTRALERQGHTEMNYRMGKAAASDKVARQHGAMEYTEAPVDLDAVRQYRLGRLRNEMRKRDVAGLLLFDQISTRYATDATNMQVWCSHYETRCVFVALEGPVVLFDYANHPFLAEDLPTVDEYRVMPTFYYFA